MVEEVGGWVGGWVDRWVGGWMNRWVVGWVGGWGRYLELVDSLAVEFLGVGRLVEVQVAVERGGWVGG